MTSVQCAYDGAPAIARCMSCDEEVCANCHGSSLVGFCMCRSCRHEIESKLRTPWEVARTPREQLRSFIPTIGEILKSPNTYFLRKIPVGGVLGPAIFGIICLTIGIAVRRLYNWFLVDGYSERFTEAALDFGLSGSELFLINLGAAPFTAIIGFILHAAVFHLLATSMGGKAPWHVTTRIAAFSCAAVILQIIPPAFGLDIGHFIALLWLIFLESHAVRAYHQISLWRGTAVVFAAMFVLLPFMG